MKTSNAGVIAGLNAITALLDAGAGAAVIKIYNGTQPADPSVAVGVQTLLGTVVCTDPAFPSAIDATGSATATASAITAGLAVAVGTASWFRASDSNGVAVFDGDAGQGSGELNLDDNTFEINDNISVNSWVITMAE